MLAVVEGIAEACSLAGCALLGGETAEMPGVYAPGDFDLAGFAVGLVDGARLPDPSTVAVGDVVLALPSTGVHSNGLSLARKALLERGGLRLDQHCASLNANLGDVLLTPTAIYVRDVLQLHRIGTIKAAAHITGGGITGRATRLLQPGQRLRLNQSTYSVPPIFDLIAQAGDVDIAEMRTTFNMGLGYIMVMAPDVAQACLAKGPKGTLQVGSIIAGEAGIDFV